MESPLKGTFADRLNISNLTMPSGDICDKKSKKNRRNSTHETLADESANIINLSSSLQAGEIKGYLKHKNPLDNFSSIQEDYIRLHEKDLDAKRVIKVGFGKDNVQEKKKIESKGKGWFNFPSNESEEVRKASKIIQMRNALDPKRFYKKSEHKSDIPKFAQIGTVVTDAHDFYDRATKSERKSTIVEEMLADIESKKKLKKRFKTVKPLVAKKKWKKGPEKSKNFKKKKQFTRNKPKKQQ